jgi:hypothetical protein
MGERTLDLFYSFVYLSHSSTDLSKSSHVLAEATDDNETEEETDVDVVDGSGDFPESELPSLIDKIGHDFGDWLELRKKTIERLEIWLSRNQ